MTDFEYDIYQRKLLARNAKYRVCGSKSKKCTLNSDRLTPKQMRERNGPLMIYKFDAPMKWDDFKKCPVDIQKSYIHKLIDDYDVTITALSQMFNVSRGTLHRHFKSNNFEYQFKTGKNMSLDNTARWNAFLGISNLIPLDSKEDCVETTKEITPESEEMPENKEEPLSKAEGMKLRSIELVYKNDIDLIEIANNLRFILGNNPNGEIRISYNIA